TRRGDLRARRRAFTLVEVLTVVAVMTVLAAIVLPVLGSVREAAHGGACMSNLRQLAAAFHMYSEDFDERLPGSGIVLNVGETSGGHWVPGGVPVRYPDGLAVEEGVLFPYVANIGVYACPSDPASR